MPAPALDQSDASFHQALTGLPGGTGLELLLVPDNIIRHIVVTVDNLSRKKVAANQRPIKPTAGQFMTLSNGDQVTINPENYARYRPFVEAVTALDVQQTVTLYYHFYPLFQSAFDDLGYKDGYFNDRLIEVIDHLLATPGCGRSGGARAAQRHVPVCGPCAGGAVAGSEDADPHGAGQRGPPQIPAAGTEDPAAGAPAPPQLKPSHEEIRPVRLIGMLDSPYVRRAAIGLQCLGLAFEHRPVSVFRAFDEFKAINPVVKAPTLVCDDGTVLMDSSVILDYAQALARRSLLPATLPELTRELRIVALALAACDKSVQVIYERELRPPERQHEPWAIRVGAQALAAYAGLEAELVRQPFPPGSAALTQAGIITAVGWHFTQAMLPQLLAAAQFPALAAFSRQAEALAPFRAAPRMGRGPTDRLPSCDAAWGPTGSIARAAVGVL